MKWCVNFSLKQWSSNLGHASGWERFLLESLGPGKGGAAMVSEGPSGDTSLELWGSQCVKWQRWTWGPCRSRAFPFLWGEIPSAPFYRWGAEAYRRADTYSSSPGHQVPPSDGTRMQVLVFLLSKPRPFSYSPQRGQQLKAGGTGTHSGRGLPLSEPQFPICKVKVRYANIYKRV